MWTVTLLLWPQVVTAHLLGGFTTLSLLWLLVSALRWLCMEITPKAARQKNRAFARLGGSEFIGCDAANRIGRMDNV
jgi:cytochrome c oxidase assembly protein subunit 15